MLLSLPHCWDLSAVGSTNCEGETYTKQGVLSPIHDSHQQIAYTGLSFTVQRMASKHVAHESNFEVSDSYFLLFNVSRGTCTPLVQSFFFFNSTKGAKDARPTTHIISSQKIKNKNKQPPFKNENL